MNHQERENQEILYTLLPYFQDFSIIDVKNELIPDVFTNDEFTSIIVIENADIQLDKLMFLLIYKPNCLQQFLRAIGKTYDWLIEVFNNKDRIISHAYISTLRNIVNENSKHFELNIHRLDLLWELQCKLKLLRPNDYCVIHGDILFGKKWLALDACCNYSVMKSMNFNIFWLNLSNCNTIEKVALILNHLLFQLNFDPLDNKYLAVDDLESRIYLLRKKINDIFDSDQYKQSLIVLVNAENKSIIDALTLNCKILITTKNEEVVDQLSTKSDPIRVSKGLTVKESYELFSKVLKTNKIPREANDIYRACGGNPFIIQLIARNLRKYGHKKSQWTYYKKSLLENRFTNDKYYGFLGQSIQRLTTAEKQLYESLAIFPYNVNIPITMLTNYWKKTENDIEGIIKKFDQLYLLEFCFNENARFEFILHFHYYSYLKMVLTLEQISEMHRTLINNYNITNDIQVELYHSKLLHDGYFYYMIAFHLKEANMFDLFPKLFLDLRFLEEKLRETGLVNTLSDLSLYRNYIIGTNKTDRLFFKKILQFLPYIVEFILKSEDTSLIQYAILTHGILQKRALEQAIQTPQHIWFTDNNHTYNHRQIVEIEHSIVKIKFIEANMVLLALSNHDVILKDLSTSNANNPIMYSGHDSKIIDIQIAFKTFFISLDANGICLIWKIDLKSFQSTGDSISKNHNQPVINRFNNVPNSIESYIQKIELERFDPIKCIYSYNNNDHLYLLVATKNGQIKTYEWINDTHKYTGCPSFNLSTHIKGIVRICLLCNVNLIILDERGKFYFYNMVNSAETFRPKWELIGCPVGLHSFKESSLIAVVSDGVHLNKAQDEYYTLHKIYSPCDNIIMCSAMSCDGQYLFLGTQKGLLVIDLNNYFEVLTNNVSETIDVIDVLKMDGTAFRLVLLCATKQMSLGAVLYGLEKDVKYKAIHWTSPYHHIACPTNKHISRRVQLNARLLGKRYFTVKYLNEKNQKMFIALDTRGNVYREIYGNKFKREEPTQTIDAKVDIMSETFIGCQKGDVWEVHNLDQYCSFKPIMVLNSTITFLKSFDKAVVAGTDENFKIKWNDEEFNLKSDRISKAFLTERLIILVKSNCSIDIFISVLWEHCSIFKDEIGHSYKYGGCDMKDNKLVVASSLGRIQIYKIHNLKMYIICSEMVQVESSITCLNLSDKSEYLAIGLNTGTIQIYETRTLKLLGHLNSHKTQINDMVFCPWHSKHKASIILVSLAESICFWNITFLTNLTRCDESKHNNQIVNSIKNYVIEDTQIIVNPWIRKFSFKSKQELIACIKLYGNAAHKIFTNTDFTLFNTIDDEGEVYNLKIIM